MPMSQERIETDTNTIISVSVYPFGFFDPTRPELGVGNSPYFELGVDRGPNTVIGMEIYTEKKQEAPWIEIRHKSGAVTRLFCQHCLIKWDST